MLLCISALVFLPISLAGATYIAVPDGTTETTTITLPDLFDTLFIDQGGAIDTRGGGFVEGVRAINDDQTVDNAGTISAGNAGILSTGARFAITNSGKIISFFWGVYALESNAKITNNGMINAGQYGYFSPGSNAEITNRGVVAGKAFSIRLTGSDAILNLLAGSVLDGAVELQSTGATLNIGIELNLYLDYTGELATLNSAIPFSMARQTRSTRRGCASAQSFVQTTAEAVHDALHAGSALQNRFAFNRQNPF